MSGSRPLVGLSTASVYPQSVESAFRFAAELGYDGIELMVWADPVSQDSRTVARLSAHYRVPVLSVHAPCLIVTQRVWSPDPTIRLLRATETARHLGAQTVVVHPPFRWQRGYARNFAAIVEELAEHAGVSIAVENMFPVHAVGARLMPYSPSEDPTEVGHRHYTLDLSHTAAAGTDAQALMRRMGDGLAHVHLADGSGRFRDEHLIPGRGSQPCARICAELANSGFAGVVVLEVNTQPARSPTERARMLAESLLFARKHLTTTRRDQRRKAPKSGASSATPNLAASTRP